MIACLKKHGKFLLLFALVLVFDLISVVCSLLLGADEIGPSLIFAVVSVVAVVLYLLCGNEIVLPVMAALSALTVGLFLTENYGTVIDYIYKVNFWGNAENFGKVVTVACALLLSAILATVACFCNCSIKKSKEKTL